MKRSLAVVLLVAATLLAFAPVTGTGFVDYDDDIYVSHNAHIQRPIDAESVRWALTSFYASNWHPVTWLSHMVDWQIYGAAPLGHHVTSLLLHLASVLVLFFALERMTGACGRSFLAAALFAVHPLHVESVVWLAERKDVLCALFWFLAIGAYARWSEARRLSWGLGVLLFAALAMMSKPMAVTLPLTLLLLDYWPLDGSKRRSRVALVGEKAPLFLLSAATAWVTIAAQHAGQSILSVAEVPLGQRAGNAAVACVSYLVKMVWPVQLAVFYPHPGATLAVWKIAGACGVLALVSFLAARAHRTRPYLLFGWLWYLVTLVPVIGLVQVGRQAMADRYTYVPLIGIFVALSWAAGDAIASGAGRRRQSDRTRLAIVSASVVVLVLIGLTRFQVRFWNNAETLFSRALAVTAGNDVAHSHLGVLRAREGRLDEADAQFREVLRLRPGSALAHLDMGTNLVQRGKLDEALAELRTAVSLDPNDPRVQSNLGGVLEMQGKLDEARSHFAEAVRLDPGFAAARLGLGSVASREGKLDEAVGHYLETIRLNPASAAAHDRVGMVLVGLGRSDEAYVHFAEAARIDPMRAETQNNWGTALARQSRYREAAAHFAEAIRLAPNLAQAHFSLAAASFFLEDYPTAWREVRAARSLGLEPPPGFLQALQAKMPEPR